MGWLTICRASWKISGTVLIFHMLSKQELQHLSRHEPNQHWLMLTCIIHFQCVTGCKDPHKQDVQHFLSVSISSLIDSFGHHTLCLIHFTDIRAVLVTKGARFPLSWYAAGATGVPSIGPVTEDRPEDEELSISLSTACDNGAAQGVSEHSFAKSPCSKTHQWLAKISLYSHVGCCNWLSNCTKLWRWTILPRGPLSLRVSSSCWTLMLLLGVRVKPGVRIYTS